MDGCCGTRNREVDEWLHVKRTACLRAYIQLELSCLSETPSKSLGLSYLHVSQGCFPRAAHFDTFIPGCRAHPFHLHPLLFLPSSQPPFPGVYGSRLSPAAIAKSSPQRRRAHHSISLGTSTECLPGPLPASKYTADPCLPSSLSIYPSLLSGARIWTATNPNKRTLNQFPPPRPTLPARRILRYS